MKYSSITTAQSSYAVFVNRNNVEDVEATVVSAWALTDTGATIALMPSQLEFDPQLVPVEDNDKRIFKTFYFGDDPLSYLQQFQVKMRLEKSEQSNGATPDSDQFHEPEVF